MSLIAFKIRFLLFSLSFLAILSSGKIVCRNEQTGHEVDW